jgi:hypothetical protein
MPGQHGNRPDREFLERVSNEVHDLFFLSAVNMKRFKAQVQAAIEYQKRHDDARAELDRREAELERREQEHSEKVKRDARLRDQKAGPPKDGWEWNEEFPFEDGAWLPPELARKSDLPPRPIPHGVPLAFDSGRSTPKTPWKIGLTGRYVILGIVHDNSDRARPHYRPELLKGFDLPLAFSVCRDCGTGSDTGEMGFADFDRDSIERALIDVKADLASHQMRTGGGARQGSGDGRRKTPGKMRPLLDRKCQRIWDGARWHDVTAEQLGMLEVLFKAKGSWVQGKVLGGRPDKLRKTMPSGVRKIVETHQTNGYRIFALLPK